MATHITIEGNLTDTPQGGVSPAGKSYTRFTVAVNNRVRNREGAWTDGPTSFYRTVAFGQLADNITNSLDKG